MHERFQSALNDTPAKLKNELLYAPYELPRSMVARAAYDLLKHEPEGEYTASIKEYLKVAVEKHRTASKRADDLYELCRIFQYAAWQLNQETD